MALALPRSAVAPKREVFGFAPYWNLNLYREWNYRLLSTIAYFGLDVNDNGTFANQGGGWVGWNSADLTGMINAAHGAGDRVVVVIKDFRDASINNVVATGARQILIQNTIAAIASNNLDGVNVDFEGVESPLFPDLQIGITTLMTELSLAVHTRWPQAEVSIDTYAGSASWDGGVFKIGDLAPVVDAMFVMAYDSVFSNMPGQAGPQSPMTGWTYNDTVDIAQYLTKAPASKIILGVPYYGYKWSTQNGNPNSWATSGATAEVYSDVVWELNCGHLALTRGWDAYGQSPWVSWWSAPPGVFDPCGGNLGSPRELYYDDATSLGIKYDLVNSTNIRGTGMWTLGGDSGLPDLWNELALKFTPTSPSWTPNIATESSSFPTQAIGTQSGAQTITFTNGSISSVTVSAVNLSGANTGDFTKGTDNCTSHAVAALATCTVQYTFTPTDNGVRNATVTFVSNGLNNPTSALVGVGGVSGAATTLYLPWYDFASPGVNADTIHITNPTGALASGTIALPGAVALVFNIGPGQDAYYSFPHGTIGGPVVINSTTVPVIATLRAWYYQSFNETQARPAVDAATALYFPWYDLASPGVNADTIHITDPGSAPATGTITLGASTINFAVAAGADAYYTFPYGTTGGPVAINSSQPVLATLRAWYYQSFNETSARPASAATTTQYFPWYDTASAGVHADKIHITNVSGAVATGSIALPGATSIPFSVPTGQDLYYSFPDGTIGGPVKITSSQPVLASLRAWYYQSFNEVPGRSASPSSATQYLPWYDHLSAGVNAATIHITNTGTATVTGIISKPGDSPISFTVAGGQDGFFAFPWGSYGGPVTIAASGPVLASLRAWYYQSFNEVSATF
jgi:GH18 family chitinase